MTAASRGIGPIQIGVLALTIAVAVACVDDGPPSPPNEATAVTVEETREPTTPVPGADSTGRFLVDLTHCQGDGLVTASVIWTRAPDFDGTYILRLFDPIGELHQEIAKVALFHGGAFLGGLAPSMTYRYEVLAGDELWAVGSFRTGRCVQDEAPCPAGSSFISHGPIVGEVTDTTAKIWVRTCQPTRMVVQYKRPGEPWVGGGVHSGLVELTADRDNTGVATLEGLAPATEYQYRVLVEGQIAATHPPGRFRTMPQKGSGAAFSFIVGADIFPLYRPHRIFNRIAAHQPDFALLIGDQIYVDPAGSFSPETKSDYERVYREAWAEDNFRSFLATTPTFMIWDDHEILNDWDRGKVFPYNLARAAYEEYVNAFNPEPRREGELYYAFDVGDVGFYVLDTRSHRSPEDEADGPDKTILGRQQKEDLKEWLRSSEHTFKFIVSSVMWSDFAKHTEEAWVSYKTERDEIFDFIKLEGVDNVVLLSGDEHWTGVFRLDPWGLYEISPTPLNAFTPVQIRFDDPQVLFAAPIAQTYALFQVDTIADPPGMTVKIFDDTGERFTLSLTSAELQNEP